MSGKVIRKEIRFAVHLPEREGQRDDAYFVKEQHYYEDGHQEPHIRIYKDVKRPVWVTRKAFRNHKEKKEFEKLESLNKYECTESELPRVVARALEQPHLMSRPNLIKESPYVYGYDITGTSLLKFRNLVKNKNKISRNTICTLDIEATPFTRQLLCISICMYDKTFTAVVKDFWNHKYYKQMFRDAKKEYLPDHMHIQSDIEIYDDDVQCIRGIFNKLHEWMPDFLVIWNMDYDIPFLLEKLEEKGIDPRKVIADPRVPYEYRYVKYKQGPKKKVTASGVVKPINPSLQWHTLYATASFYVIDAMCVYRQLRMAKQEEPSYALDAILQKELGTRKLKFELADKYTGTQWHLYMQENHPLEYIIYNLYDGISVLELDAKTNDIQMTLPTFAGITDYDRFNSNPKKIVDALFQFGLKKGLVVGTGCKPKKKDKEGNGKGYLAAYDEFGEVDAYDPEEELADLGYMTNVDDFETLDLKGWIQTLPQHLMHHEGLRCVEEFPDLVTNIRALVFDADVCSSYPSVTNACNVSKSTTYSELITVNGVDELTFRECNLGIVASDANTLRYFNKMFGTPSLLEL